MRTTFPIIIKGIFEMSIILSLMGCSLITPSGCNQEFLDLFLDVRMTNQIDLEQFEFGSTEKFEDIDLLIKNNTAEYLHLSYDMGIQMFVCENGQWNSINDRAKRFGKTEEIIPPKGNKQGENISGFSVSPNYIGPSAIRIMVIFSIYQEGKVTDKKIGTYIDIKR